ncbi:MAG: hypothetical protein HZB67_03290 [Candidatus Aenigmarchaeota archaeon]|nr:hypothetical protein [Candidatus Aenigmarchaeota archaeon]
MKKRIQTSVTLDKETIDWIDEQISQKVFASRSHAIEFCIHRMKEKKF